VEASGIAQISIVRALDIRADGVIATRLGLEESTPLFHLERLRLAGDEPLALDRVWMPASIAEPLLTADFRRTSLYEALLALTGVPITGGAETVRAVIPSKAEHSALGLAPPAAAFAVERTATSSGVPIEWRKTLIRADRFSLTNTLSGLANRGWATGTPTLNLAPSMH
jgi:GntR family transcriptional regulator